MYLHTPIVTASDAEGAGEMFRVTTLPFNNPPRNEDDTINFKEDFFGKSTNLTEKEKQLYGSINEQNKLVVQKILQYSVSNPEIVPTHVDMPELNSDYAGRNTLELWEDALTLMLSNIQNAKILLDYDVFQACLSVYRNVRYQAGEDVPGMTTIYNDLKQFFPGGSNTAPATPANG